MNNPYTKLARQAIEEYVKDGKALIMPKKLPKELIAKRAGIFVSIHSRPSMSLGASGSTRKENEVRIDAEGELRGCIGTILPTKDNIAQEIIDNAISACSQDNRFPPITKDELNNLEISVDVLTEPEIVSGDLRLAMNQLDPQKYGVIVKSEDGRTGLLLPNLPGVDSAEYQIAIARSKAGINPTEPIFLFRFEVTRYK